MRRNALVIAPLVALALAAPRLARAGDLLYAESNDGTANQLVVLARSGDHLVRRWTVPTGGRGSGSGLGSQGAVTLADDGRWLVAVNAGSDDVSLFYLTPAGRPHLVAIAPAGGPRPISATIRGQLIYVLHDAGIAGFERAGATLAPLAGSTQPLSASGAGPAQIAFAPDGGALLVTEKATGCIDTFMLDDDGRAGPPTCHVSAGPTPFGFGFVERRDGFGNPIDALIVSEAAGGAAGAASASSYLLDDDVPMTVSAAVATDQSAACWIVAARRRYVYTTNTGSGTLTGFRVERDGSLVRLDATGATGTTGGAPIDAAASGDGERLYVLDGKLHAIVAFRVKHDGALVRIGDVAAVPATTVGLAVR